MLRFQSNVSLANLNSFGFSVVAEEYVVLDQTSQLPELINYVRTRHLPLLVLGGGSNLILADDIPGVVAHIQLQGYQLISEQRDHVIIRVAAGEPWHETVKRSLADGYYGLENLALIPGSVGAAPVQNIGAYGVELKDRLKRLQVYDTQTEALVWLSPEDCQFGYRESLFKSMEPNRFIITCVEFKLTKDSMQVNLGYQALKETCVKLSNNAAITPDHVFEAVCYLRQQKLPNPSEIGNVGSFFKNPRVSKTDYLSLKKRFPALVGFADKGAYKLAAGWLIETCGWKGQFIDSVGVYDKQALVLVNRGGGNREQVESLAASIAESVLQTFGVRLEVEPRFYP